MMKRSGLYIAETLDPGVRWLSSPVLSLPCDTASLIDAVSDQKVGEELDRLMKSEFFRSRPVPAVAGPRT